MLELTLLGAFGASYEGQSLTFQTHPARALFAFLVVETGQPHTRNALAGMLWPDQSQKSASTNLRQTLARIRKAVPDPPSVDAIMQITRHEVQVDAGAITSDLARFEALMQAVAHHRHEGAQAHHCSICAEQLSEAVALYKGEFLQGMFLDHSEPFEEWLLLKREQWQRQVLNALSRLVEYAEATNDYERMADFSRRQLALDPLREETHAQLMRALALSGQRMAAMVQYAACARIMQDEFGIEPSAELNALHERIRAGAFEPASLTAPVPAHNLPSHLTTFVGRKRELNYITSQLRIATPETRLFTLTGMGGVGKTRLAIEARRACLDAYQDGVYFVSLASLNSPADITPAIATAIGFTTTSGELESVLLLAMRDRRMLLILDNFEHLLGTDSLGGAAMVVRLLEAAPAVRILATSRERLNVRGERVITMNGMDLPEGTFAEAAQSSSVQLFVQRAHHAQPAFKLTEDNVASVLQICRSVQGVPLAIELAAAWAGTMPLNNIFEAIEQSMDFLAFDWRDVPARQRSMRAVFNWSWQLLTQTEQQALRRLSVFHGSFTQDAAQAITGTTRHTLISLIHKSLLSISDAGRYAMHELVRQFAAERLQEQPDEAQNILAKHASYYLAFLSARERRLARNEPHAATVEIVTELDNIRRAWDWAAEHGARKSLVDCAFVLWMFFSITGRTNESEKMFAHAIESLQTGIPGQDTTQRHDELAKLLGVWSLSLVQCNQHERARQQAQQAIEWARAGHHLIHREAVGLGTFALAQVSKWQGNFEMALAQCESVLADIAAHQQAGGAMSEVLHEIVCGAHMWIGHLVQQIPDRAASSRSHLQKALGICVSLGKLRGEMVCRTNLADLYRTEGEILEAQNEYTHALELAKTLGYRWGEGVSEMELAETLKQRGEYDQACMLHEKAIVVFSESGDASHQAMATACLGRIYAYMGASERARACLDQSLKLARNSRASNAELVGLGSLALLQHFNGDDEGALAHAQRGWQIAHVQSGAFDQANVLVILGHVQFSMGNLTAAASSYQMARDTFTGLGYSHIAIEPAAGLARIALLQGDLLRAMSGVENILPVLMTRPSIGLDEPFFTSLACAQVLRAAGDARANQVLDAACARLQAYAGQISDVASRQSFLNAVPVHRELITMQLAGIDNPQDSQASEREWLTSK